MKRGEEINGTERTVVGNCNVMYISATYGSHFHGVTDFVTIAALMTEFPWLSNIIFFVLFLKK